MIDINGTPKPCMPYPADAEYKTIGLGPCPRCHSSDCWRRYLSWEKKQGITINAKDHPAEVDEDHRPKPGIAITEIPIDLERGQTIAKVKLRAPGIVRAAAFWLKKPTVLGASSMRQVEHQAMPLLFVESNPTAAEQEHVFLFLPSNAGFAPRDGYVMQWRATALGQVGAMHVYEIVEGLP